MHIQSLQNIPFQSFLDWETHTRDTLDVKCIYIDLAGDLPAGVVLSEILYWYLPDRQGNSKLRVFHDGEYWIAIPRKEWWERCRLTPEQADHALRKLIARGLLEKRVFKFNGMPTVHILLRVEAFLEQWQARVGEAPGVEAPSAQPVAVPPNENGESAIPDREIRKEPLTEITNRINPPPPVGEWVVNFDQLPKTLREAKRHPDLVLFSRISGVRVPYQSDWEVIVERVQHVRAQHPELDEEGLVKAGKAYHAAWVGRGYSRTHPSWLEWWLNECVPEPRKSRRRHGQRVPRQEKTYDYSELRLKAAQLLEPDIQRMANGEGRQ